ncbi:MAG: glutamate decarboxylase [Gammaproteobacteria bacterium]
MLTYKKQLSSIPEEEQFHTLTYGSRYASQAIPKYSIPEEKMPPNLAYQVIHDELALDGTASLNLASFVTTWMDEEAHRLLNETLNKNYIDQNEYPQTTELHNRCVNMLARLYHSPEHEIAVGTATVGSSEAIHLAGLAMKWDWRKRRQAQGKTADKPNIVMGQNVQVCWEKFARYFEVDPRMVPLTHDRFVLGVEEALQCVDENTIAVVGILGSTYTGEYEPIAELNNQLEILNKKTGWDIPIHVDAASGGFVAPFISPELIWDFRLSLVQSINVSGHKYGLVYPGVGWVIWRDKSALPEELIFHVNYLGSDQPTFNLNFSKGAAQILGQYYNFLRLGKAGYRQIMLALQNTANWLTNEIEKTEKFNILSKTNHLPVVTFSLQDTTRYTVFDISEKLRERGWIVPAYTLAPNANDIAVLRIVVRENLSHDMANLFIADLQRALEYFEKHGKMKGVENKRKLSVNQGVC